MTIYPLSGASWPAKQQSSALEEAHGSGRRKEMQTYPSSFRGSPRQWELRKIASFPVIDADYWSDASLSLPHLASALPRDDEEKERVFISRGPQIDEAIQSTYNEMSNQVDEPMIKARGGSFPPPLDSPASLMYEERYSHLERLERVSFRSVRSNGRLLVTETPKAAHPRRSLHCHRRNGRLLLQLYVESTTTEEYPLAAGAEEYDPLANQNNPSAEEATTMNPITAQKAKAKKANPILVEVEEGMQHEAEDDEGGDNVNGKVCLYTKVLKTLECDVLSNVDAAEAISCPIQPHLKYGRSSSVASFLHKSLTRVRPLSIWQGSILG